MTKLTSKDHILYDINHITFSTNQNYRNGEEVSGCQGFGMVCGMDMTVKGQCEGDLYGDREALYLDCYGGSMNLRSG